MRLFELENWDTLPLKKKDFPRSLNQKALNNFFDRMIAKGFVLINSGGFGAVFEHPSHPYVAKIYRLDDKAYTAYLNYCASHQTRDSVPRILGERRSITDKFDVVLLEKLHELSADEDSALRLTLRSLDEALKTCDSAQALAAGMKEYQDQKHRGTLRWDFLPVGGDFIETLFEVGQVRVAGGFYWDLKASNFMMRDRTLVIVDPLKIGIF